jgi:hypothetical protein
VLLFFRDAAGRALGGVEVGASGAEFVAYASGDIWDDTLGATAARGAALIGNVSAPEFPGGTVTIAIGGGSPGAFPLRAAAGAVTIAEVVR